MTLTVGEALKKRCYRDLSSECVATMCMAWRWDSKQTIGEYDQQYGEPKTPERRKGFCGAAGAP